MRLYSSCSPHLPSIVRVVVPLPCIQLAPVAPLDMIHPSLQADKRSVNMERNINVLLSTFPGLGLPQTVCIPVPANTSSLDLHSLIGNLLPSHARPDLYLTTTNNRRLNPSSTTTVARIITPTCSPHGSSSILPLCLTAPLPGGKGGFGSQLRAAGGRMSSRKKRQNAELATGSARNLDGRRLRTIKEAKNLATYLAARPEMDRRQKEERRKRWEQVIDLAEQREADMRAGKGVDGRRKGLSEQWLEEKEDVADNVKNAVKLALAADLGPDKAQDKIHGSGSDQSAADSADDDSEDEDPMELGEHDMARLTREAESGDTDALWVLKNKLKIPASMLPKQKPQQRRFAGFDDDDDDDDDDDELSSDSDHGKPTEALNKGKEVQRDT